MTVVDIKQEIYAKVVEIVSKKSIDYPTIQNFVNKAVREKIAKEDDDNEETE